jgi:hypothetical protein
MSADGRTKCLAGPSEKLSVPFDVTRRCRLGDVTKTVPGCNACPSWTQLTAQGVWRRRTSSGALGCPERRCCTTTMTGGNSAGRPERTWQKASPPDGPRHGYKTETDVGGVRVGGRTVGRIVGPPLVR